MQALSWRDDSSCVGIFLDLQRYANRSLKSTEIGVTYCKPVTRYSLLNYAPRMMFGFGSAQFSSQTELHFSTDRIGLA